MKSTYTLPACGAVALHAIFFLGSKTPAPSHTARPFVVDDFGPPALIIPLPPLEPAIEEETVPVIVRKSDRIDTSEIAPEPEEIAPPQSPEPVSLPTVLPERMVLSTEGFAQHPHRYHQGEGDLAAGAAQRFGGVLAAGALDRIPDARLRVPPRYPDALRRAGREATVVVTFVVGEDGRVMDARADEQAPREFAEAAEQAVRRWRFEPGTRLGAPVSFRMSVPLVFSISG